MREAIGALREAEAEKQTEARGEPPEDVEWDDIDPKSEAVTKMIRLKTPEKIFHKLLQNKLKENACRNRGYVLDGYPRTHYDA